MLRKLLSYFAMGFIFHITLLAVIGSAYMVARRTLLMDAYTIEEELVRRDANRAVKNLLFRLERTTVTMKDYSNWDDTWLFVQGKLSGYTDENFSFPSFKNLGLDFIAVYDAAGTEVWAEGYDPETNGRRLVPSGLFARAFVDGVVKNAVSGIYRLDGLPAAVAAGPVLRTTGEGPIAGYLLMGFFLDRKVESEVSEAAEVELRFLDPDSIDGLPPPVTALLSAPGGAPPSVVPRGETLIEGYSLFKDDHDKPVLILRTSQSRPVYRKALETLRYYLTVLLIIWAVTALVVQIMLIFLRRTSFRHQVVQNLYTSVVETSPDAIVLTDRNGRISFCNDRAAALLGYAAPEELIGRFGYDLIAPEERKRFVFLAKENGADGVRNAEFRFVLKDGSHRYGEINSRIIYSPKGELRRIVSIVRDVTDRKIQEEEKRRLLEDITNRRAELEAIIGVSASLRRAGNREEIIPLMLEQFQSLFQAPKVLFMRPITEAGFFQIDAALGAWTEGVGLSLNLYRPAAAEEEIYRYFTDPEEAPKDLRELPGGPAAFMACFSLITRDEQRIGRILIGRSAKFDLQELRLGAAVSDIFANALQRVTLGDQTRERLRRLEALRSIDIAISTSLDLTEVLEVILRQVRERLSVDGASVLLYGEAQGVLTCGAFSGFKTREMEGLRLKKGEGLAGRAAADGKHLIMEDLRSIGNSHFGYRLYSAEGFVSYAAMPLLAKGRLLGVLEVMNRSKFLFPESWVDFLETLAGQAAIALDNAELFSGLQDSNQRLSRAYEATIEGWAQTLELRDHDTEGHSRRVTEASLALARALDYPEEDLIDLRYGALLHDIGKMGVPDAILLKPGRLDEEEMAMMQGHAEIGRKLLSEIEFLQKAVDIPWAHHEKWDGTGYPRGLAGKDIPLGARIFAIVDVWDALRSDRPYRAAWPEEKVLEHIESLAGTHFDPEVAAAFVGMRRSASP
jgi:PAS domain S-box-containing protein/putative nucleotidyltransferase with HDIG domain